jgi:uncharacterized protein (DUF2336 family)
LAYSFDPIEYLLIGVVMHIEPKPSLDTTIFTNVIANSDVASRCKLAEQLAAFLADAESHEIDRSQIVPIVLKLAVDPVKEVRRKLVAGLNSVENLNADIVFSIIADEDDIALPFLKLTPALNHWHMLAVLRVGDEARQLIVVQRGDISAEALAYAVKAGPLEICIALFGNRTVKFDEAAYRTLFNRFGQVPELAELLLSRPDLPLDLRIMQAKRASNRMHQLMAEKGWIAANDAAELVADAEDTTILRILVEASNQELARAIPFLVSKNMLVPSIILRAAAIGEMKVVQWSLAHLAGVTVARAYDMMFGRGLTGLKSLHKKCGLPQSCYGLLQAACDVVKDAREEKLPLDPESFGRRLIEALMTRYEHMQVSERTKNLEFIGRFAEDRVRKIAQRLRADMGRAA